MLVVVAHGPVGDGGELAVLTGHAPCSLPAHERLGLPPVPHEFGHGDGHQTVLGGERGELRAVGHRSVVAGDLGQDPGRREPGETAEVDGALGVPGPPQDAALAGDEGEHVPGSGELLGSNGGVGQRADGQRAVGGRDARAGGVLEVDRDGERGAVRVVAVGDHRRQPQRRGAGRLDADAEDPACVADHERERFRGGVLGGHDEVALVLPVLVVDDQHHPPPPQLGEGDLDTSGPRRAFVARVGVRHTRRLSSVKLYICVFPRRHQRDAARQHLVPRLLRRGHRRS